jgi:azurin
MPMFDADFRRVSRQRLGFWLRRTAVLTLFVLQACSRSTASAQGDAGPVVLRVATDGEFLAYAPTELTCPAGARVRVIFHHGGQRLPQDHNWVLVMPGAAEAIAQAGTAAGLQAGFVPKDRRVIAATPLCGRGAEAMVEFTAPAAGDYPFICTFPGHAAEMHGVLHVTKF